MTTWVSEGEVSIATLANTMFGGASKAKLRLTGPKTV